MSAPDTNLKAADWLCLGAAPTFRNHGALYGCPWWRRAGYALLTHARCVTAERHVPDVFG
jgi:hypothetical protein